MTEKYVPWTRERQSAANEYVPWVRPTAKENRYVPFYSSARSGKVLNNTGVISSNNVVAGPRVDCLDTKYLTSVIPSPKGVTTVDTRFLWPEMFEWSKESCPKWFHGFYDDTYIEIEYEAATTCNITVNLGHGAALLQRIMPKSSGTATSKKIIKIAEKDDSSVYGSIICPSEIKALRGCSDLFDQVRISTDSGKGIAIKYINITLNGKMILDLYFAGDSHLLIAGDVLDLDRQIRAYRLGRLGFPEHYFIHGILAAAANDYGQAWSPKYGSYWDKEANGSWGDSPHDWCSEFAAYCIRKGTMNYPGGPLCNPNEIYRNLDFNTPWTFGTNISAPAMRTYFQNCGRFISPKTYYYLDDADNVIIVPRTEYSDLGRLVKQGFYLNQFHYDDPKWVENHSVIFIDWSNSFNPARDARNGFHTIERGSGVIIRERYLAGPDYIGTEHIDFKWFDEGHQLNQSDPDLSGWDDTYQSYIMNRGPINGFGNTHL